ncbi:MAG: hypothetical protein U0271_33270 [Polyangiaceae bacterium]
MSKFQFRVLAFCVWLVALCFGIATLALWETYSMFRDGPRVRATVTEVRATRDKDPWVKATLERDGKPETISLRTPGLKPAVGDTLELALHERNGEPRLASAIGEERPSIGLVLGFALSIALGVWLWIQPTRAERRRRMRTSVLDALVDAAARTRNVAAGVGVFMVLAAAAFAIVPFFDRSAGLGGSIFLWVLAAITLAVGLLGLRRAIALRDPKNNELLDLILNRPEEIAWVYVLRVTSEGIDASESLSAQICGADGKTRPLTLVREDLDAVLAEIARRAPHAQQGYSRELEKLYREAPARWRPTTRAPR